MKMVLGQLSLLLIIKEIGDPYIASFQAAFDDVMNVITAETGREDLHINVVRLISNSILRLKLYNGN